MPGRPTMKDIARELRLSRVTVSSVVNGRAIERGLSPVTVQRVRDYLESRGYVPSRQAVSLRDGGGDAVGILHCDRLYSHLTEAFNRLTHAFAGSPRHLQIMVVSRDNLLDGARELIARGASRILWIHTRPPEVECADRVILNYLGGVTTVVYNYHFGHPPLERELLARGFYLVGVERLAGDRILARFLSDLGHRRAVFPDNAPRDPARRQVFSKMNVEAIPLAHPDRARPPLAAGEFHAGEILKAMKKRHVTAAVFHDDELAGYTTVALQGLGVRIPRDLTVIGFDGLAIREAFAVPLTTLGVPVAKMVERAKAILNDPPVQHRHCLNLTLLEGHSHAPAPQTKLGTHSWRRVSHPPLSQTAIPTTGKGRNTRHEERNARDSER